MQPAEPPVLVAGGSLVECGRATDPEKHLGRRLAGLEHLHSEPFGPGSAVGLWLAAAWGAVVWLTAVVSMAVVEVFFPQVYGGSIFIVLIETTLLAVYLWLAIFAAREQPK